MAKELNLVSLSDLSHKEGLLTRPSERSSAQTLFKEKGMLEPRFLRDTYQPTCMGCKDGIRTTRQEDHTRQYHPQRNSKTHLDTHG
jgi:hypothetical protein